MSGESNLIWARDFDKDILGGYPESELDEMVRDLAVLGYAKDVAEETMKFMCELRAFKIRIGVMYERLQPVWKAKAYWDSCDSNEQHFKQELAVYRGELKYDASTRTYIKP